MTALLLTVAGGPVMMMAVLAGLGIPCGYYLGFTASCVALPIAAIALGVGYGKVADRMTGALAVIAATVTGLASAYGCNIVREVRTGELAQHVALAELSHQLDTDRLTLRDGVARRDLGHGSSREDVSGPASERWRVESACEAYPIVPAGWTASQPVTVWRFGDLPVSQFRPLADDVFRPGVPSELCRDAIARASAAFHLQTARDAVNLEQLVTTSADVETNELTGAFACASDGASSRTASAALSMIAIAVASRRV